jgi:hypothetical protein
MIPDNDEALITDFRAWLMTKDPLEKYQYVDLKGCAFAQYLRACLPDEDISVGVFSFSINDHDRLLPEVIDKAVHQTQGTIRTFDRALQKLDELLAKNSS